MVYSRSKSTSSEAKCPSPRHCRGDESGQLQITDPEASQVYSHAHEAVCEQGEKDGISHLARSGGVGLSGHRAGVGLLLRVGEEQDLDSTELLFSASAPTEKYGIEWIAASIVSSPSNP